MRYLLDTHVLVSAVSAMEVSTKVRLGRLPRGRALVEAWSSRIAELGADELAISSEHAVLAGTMTWGQRDPFDRLLVAQSVVENVTLVTQDAAIRELPGVRLLAW